MKNGTDSIQNVSRFLFFIRNVDIETSLKRKKEECRKRPAYIHTCVHIYVISST